MPRYRRPSDRVERLVAMLRAGVYLDVALQATGLGTVDLGKNPALVTRVAQARAEAEARAVTQIAQAAQVNWQAAAWLLERQYPDRWARPGARPADEADQEVRSDSLDELAGRRAARRSGFA